MGTSPRSTGDVELVTVRFRPQMWANDQAVEADPQGPTEWQVPMEHLRGIQMHSYDSDTLRNEPGVPEWITSWPGPFEIEWDEDSVKFESFKPGGWGLPVPPDTPAAWGFRAIKDGMRLDIPPDRHGWFPASDEGSLFQQEWRQKLIGYMKQADVVAFIREDAGSRLTGSSTEMLRKEWNITDTTKMVAIYSTQRSHGYLYGSIYVSLGS